MKTRGVPLVSKVISMAACFVVSLALLLGVAPAEEKPASKSATSAAAAPFGSAQGKQPNDAEYTKKIREYTTEPYFLTELVDHLPASDKVLGAGRKMPREDSRAAEKSADDISAEEFGNPR